MKMLKQLKKKKGFTLVEVIVVAVIVAVLALVAVQLYQGYVTEARQNTAENLAASAASFLQSGVNSIGVDSTESQCASTLNAGEQWDLTLLGGNTVYFRAPANTQIIYEADTVKALVKDVKSIGKYEYNID